MASCGADNGLNATKVSTVMSVDENSSERFVSRVLCIGLHDVYVSLYVCVYHCMCVCE